MSHRPIVMYLGGFAKVGGIEAFARDLLLAIAPSFPERQLVMWGSRDRDHRLLNDMADSGVRIARSPWRWGCLWHLPDFILIPTGLAAILQAESVVFKRPPPRPILGFLRRASRWQGRHIPFILVMPYRPLEYWGPAPDAVEYEHFDIITVQSEDGVADLRRIGFQGRIKNIPLLPPRTFAPVEYPSRQGAGTIRLGFLGRMVPQKNIGYLLKIFQRLSGRSDIRYELHLFGDGPQREELERIHGSAHVIFHGEIPRAEVANAIDSCDIFLNTSVTEGQCLVALEVLSRGRPLVATAVGALPEVLRQNDVGRLAPLDDADAFAAKVREVADAVRTGEITPQTVVQAFRKNYDYDTIVQRYLKLLTEAGAPAERQS